MPLFETFSLSLKETERIFPWFKVPAAKVWRSKIDLPDGMLPDAVIPPSIDHTYSQYLERVISYPSLNLKGKYFTLSTYKYCRTIFGI